MEKVIIVDENDDFVRICERDQWESGEIHRNSALWLSNSKGEILLAQRALTKRHAPGKWGPAAAGTINEGETYESNIVKEAEEEIGLPLTLDQLEVGPKEIVGKVDGRRFRQWFLAKRDITLDSLKLQEEEVMAVKWISIPDLEQEMQADPNTLIGATNIFPTLIEWTKKSL